MTHIIGLLQSMTHIIYLPNWYSKEARNTNLGLEHAVFSPRKCWFTSDHDLEDVIVGWIDRGEMSVCSRHLLGLSTCSKPAPRRRWTLGVMWSVTGPRPWAEQVPAHVNFHCPYTTALAWVMCLWQNYSLTLIHKWFLIDIMDLT